MADDPNVFNQYFAQAQRQAQNPYNNGMGIGWDTISKYPPSVTTSTTEKEVTPNKLLLLEEV